MGHPEYQDSYAACTQCEKTFTCYSDDKIVLCLDCLILSHKALTAKNAALKAKLVKRTRQLKDLIDRGRLTCACPLLVGPCRSCDGMQEAIAKYHAEIEEE